MTHTKLVGPGRWSARWEDGEVGIDRVALKRVRLANRASTPVSVLKRVTQVSDEAVKRSGTFRERDVDVIDVASRSTPGAEDGEARIAEMPALSWEIARSLFLRSRIEQAENEHFFFVLEENRERTGATRTCARLPPGPSASAGRPVAGTWSANERVA